MEDLYINFVVLQTSQKNHHYVLHPLSFQILRQSQVPWDLKTQYISRQLHIDEILNDWEIVYRFNINMHYEKIIIITSCSLNGSSYDYFNLTVIHVRWNEKAHRHVIQEAWKINTTSVHFPSKLIPERALSIVTYLHWVCNRSIEGAKKAVTSSRVLSL